MAMKHKVVRFTDGKARIFVTTDISEHLADENTFINPDLSLCQGIPPELWTIRNGKIVPISDKQELKARINNSVQTPIPLGTSISQARLRRIEISLIVIAITLIGIIIKICR